MERKKIYWETLFSIAFKNHCWLFLKIMFSIQNAFFHCIDIDLRNQTARPTGVQLAIGLLASIAEGFMPMLDRSFRKTFLTIHLSQQSTHFTISLPNRTKKSKECSFLATFWNKIRLFWHPDFRRGWVGEVGVVTFFVLEVPDYESTMLIYFYIYANLTLAPLNINPIFVSSSKFGRVNAKPEE